MKRRLFLNQTARGAVMDAAGAGLLLWTDFYQKVEYRYTPWGNESFNNLVMNGEKEWHQRLTGRIRTSPADQGLIPGPVTKGLI